MPRAGSRLHEEALVGEGRAVTTNGAPDLVLTRGHVYTMDAARSWAEAVAVRAGHITAVGSSEEIEALRGSETHVVDLNGRMLLPGFQDAHLHPASGGLMQVQCDLHGTSTRQQSLERIARYADAHPEHDWILGGGWGMDAFPGGTPSKSDLDAIVPDRPVLLTNRDGHGAWVNSKALELAGISRETADPRDGRIERGETGEPSGTLQEGAMGLVERLVPETSPEEWQQAIKLAQAYLHALGITAIQDAMVVPETLDAYRALADGGELTARVEGNLLWTRDKGDEQVADLVDLRSKGTAGRLRIRGAKIFQDGVMENFTAAVLEPYLDGKGGSTQRKGLGMHAPDELAHMVTLLDAEGFQVHIHTIGDRAVRESLDAFEAARLANGTRDSRHHLAHIQLIHPDDVPRFRALGVVANAQPLWATFSGYVEDLTLPFISEQTARTMYPFGSLHRAGATIAMGSDWTVSTANPLPQIQVAVNRADPDEGDSEPFLPDERLELPTALAAFTIGSAFVNRLERETGSIEAGKLADLALLDRDLFAGDTKELGRARVMLTLVEGEPVFNHDESGW
jgi:predicted amidohydrolase YtcJ